MITEEDKRSIFLDSYREVPVEPEVLSSLDRTLRVFSGWGLNPNKLTVSNFEFAQAIVAQDSPEPRTRWAKPWLLIKSNDTQRIMQSDVYLMLRYGTYPTVTDMISLAAK